MNDPLSELEEKQATLGMGAVALRLLRGARAEGASWREGVLVMEAWFRSLLDNDRPEEPEE